MVCGGALSEFFISIMVIIVKASGITAQRAIVTDSRVLGTGEGSLSTSSLSIMESFLIEAAEI